jgi:hypothetical protein
VDALLTASGYLNIVAALALLIYWYSYAVFLPYGDLTNSLSLLVTNRHWTWINATGAIGATAGAVALPGIHAAHPGDPGTLLTVGLLLALAGTILLIGSMLWDTILWPIVVRHDARLLDFDGPLYASRTFVPFFVTAGLLYSAGYLVLGIAIAQLALFPPLTGYLLAVGAPLFGLGSLFGKLQVYPRTAGITLVGAGLLWIGVDLLG